MTKDPDGLNARERLFLEAYLVNGGNATQAYRASHPGVKDTTAAVEGWKSLRKPKVAAALEKRRQERFRALQMQGDEAIALLSLRARANLAEAYDARGRLLPFTQWPESLQLAVRVIDGEKVTLYDGLKAAELMAIATGKLKTNVLQVQFDHAGYLAGTDQPPAEEKP